MTIPKHIAIIMDGNRRWARKHGLEIIKGHRKVAEDVVENLTEACIKNKVEYLTLWAFSTENWNRDREEVTGLMNLFREIFGSNLDKINKKGVRVGFIGDLSRFDADIRENIQNWVKKTKKNNKVVVTFALNYGGRDEIVRAIKKYEIEKKLINKETSIGQDNFYNYLDTKDLPDPDLIIRPGGEKRLSGFMPWQSVYSELYFVDTLMPDFDGVELEKALLEFGRRQRRFGA